MVMKNTVLYWFPRVLCILYIVFISLFALDAFYGSNSLGYEFLAFLKHMIPSFMLIILLILSWKKELLGGILFLIAGVIFTLGYSTFQVTPVFFCISCPLFIIGVTFLMDYAVRSKSSID
jgi:hypothetical protein